ncbi:hypothetical protein FRB94_006880 [Tulasnella sp. JGI-2019a]|nr:hypothetical protein FRB94_006880 [Tulasnella sp. JGI-2019a]
MSSSDRRSPIIREDYLFWGQYLKEAVLFDKELVKGLSSDLDALLIFAGILSSVNTAFIMQSYQDLKPDPAESGGTNDLLRTLIQAVNNSTSVPTPPVDFIPSLHAIIANGLFFSSLLCSLFAAFGAVLAKQWLNEYERTGDDDDQPYHVRAHQRHIKYIGMHEYHGEGIMQTLGTILQISLFLFLIALTIWLWGVNHIIAVIVLIGVAITFASHLITTVISIFDAASPFSTRLSAYLRWLEHPTANTAVLDAHCIAWVGRIATMPESIAGVVRVAPCLPEETRRDEKLDLIIVGVRLLESIIRSNAIPLGLFNGSLIFTVNEIRNANIGWQDVPISLAQKVITQLYDTLSTVIDKDLAVTESIVQILEHANIQIPRNQFRCPTKKTLTDLVLIPSLTIEGKRAALSLLWKHYHFEFKHSTLFFPLPAEGEWQWKVAEILVDTVRADGVYDQNLERLDFRVSWAAALRLEKADAVKLLYGGTYRESPWKNVFGKSEFLTYLVSSRRVRPDDFTQTMIGLVEIGFNVDQEFHPASMAALYQWYRIRNKTSLPTSESPKRYVKLAILKFLELQFGSERSSWLEEEHVREATEAIRAYVAAVKISDPPQYGNDFEGDPHPWQTLEHLSQVVRDKYRYQGSTSVGQELWDCLVSVVELLNPGNGESDIGRRDMKAIRIVGSEEKGKEGKGKKGKTQAEGEDKNERGDGGGDGKGKKQGNEGKDKKEKTRTKGGNKNENEREREIGDRDGKEKEQGKEGKGKEKMQTDGKDENERERDNGGGDGNGKEEQGKEGEGEEARTEGDDENERERENEEENQSEEEKRENEEVRTESERENKDVEKEGKESKGEKEKVWTEDERDRERENGDGEKKKQIKANDDGEGVEELFVDPIWNT